MIRVIPVFRRAVQAAVLVLVVSAAGCDLTVTNPGPIDDAAVNEPSAWLALTNGSQKALSFAVGRLNHYGAIMASEQVASGATANRGHTNAIGEGYRFDPDEGVVNAKWSAAQQARWQSEETIRRIRAGLSEADFAKNLLAARALVYAGYSNRLLGENMCFGVIDGGAAESNTVHFTRAEEQFTEALTVAQGADAADLVTAARAGRATVRAHLGKWAEAVADAGTVPDGFVFVAPTTLSNQDENNKMIDSNLAQPFRSFTTWSTWYERYYDETGDPRVPYSVNPAIPTGDGRPIPWHFEMKYDRKRDAPYRLATGREMRLLEAEKVLRDGNAAGALALINALRTTQISDDTGLPLDPWVGATTAEVWTALKLERAIELWIEGRMMGYHRRWLEEGVPGPLPPEFDTAHPQTPDVTVPMSERVLCYPVPTNERRANPNIPLDLEYTMQTP